jgi:hypothetical protein
MFVGVKLVRMREMRLCLIFLWEKLNLFKFSAEDMQTADLSEDQGESVFPSTQL